MRREAAQAGHSNPCWAVYFGLALPCFCLLVGGCATPVADRARLFNEDGVQLYAKGDYAEALDSFDLALTLQPQDATLLFNVGQCCDRLGDVKGAEKYYGSCLLRSPKHADARMALVELLYRTQRKAQADPMIDEWVRQDPKAADSFVLEAWRLRHSKSYPEAQGRLEQALDLEPHNRRALSEQAVLYERTGMPQRAYALYERILEREPGQANVAQKLDQLRVKGVSRPLPD
jgi:tetratricopeptide (TPR) repeat protein